MKVFVIGPTGSIGAAITRELVAAGHAVSGLCRSSASAAKISAWAASAVHGDLREPAGWAGHAVACDGVIHAGATFGADEAAIDRKVIDALQSAPSDHKPRLIYTGGCWLYGQTGDEVATEDSPFNAISAFAWAVDHAEELLRSDRFRTCIIHPAMVYHADGGVFGRFLNHAKRRQPMEVWETPDKRWPLIHRDDLARAYRLLLESPDLTGHFNAAAEPGVWVGDIVVAFANRFASPPEPIVRPIDDVIAEVGDWAAGAVLDQQMSADRLTDATGWRPTHTDFRQTDVLA
jgi:nucleoside-diphosphate-sugar epimerase